MLRYTVIAVVVALAGAITTTAQEKPDFSGEWQLNRQASMLSPIVAPVAQTGTLRIEHKEPNFKCQMTIVLDGKPIETKYEMRSDGRETVATAQGRQNRVQPALGRRRVSGHVANRDSERRDDNFLSIRTARRRASPSSLGTASRRWPRPGQCVGIRAAVTQCRHKFDGWHSQEAKRSRTFYSSRPPRNCRFCPVHKLPVFSKCVRAVSIQRLPLLDASVQFITTAALWQWPGRRSETAVHPAPLPTASRIRRNSYDRERSHWCQTVPLVFSIRTRRRSI